MTPIFKVRRARFEVALRGGQEARAMEHVLVPLLRQRVMPVFESVLERFDWPEGDVVIPGIVLDLGEVTATEAAELIPKRFEARLIRQLTSHLKTLKVRHPRGEKGAYDTQAQRPEPQPPTRRTKGDGREAAFRRVLKQVLVLGRGGRNLSRMVELWPEFPWVVRHLFFYYAHERNVPRHAALYLGRDRLRQSAMLLSPEHGGFVGGFVAKTAENRLLLKHTAPVSGDADGFERLLWEFTLGYLLVEGKARFERRQYVSHLISRIASHENVDARRLLRAFQAVFLQVPGAAGQEMREILGSLARDSAAEEKKHRGSAQKGQKHGPLWEHGSLERVLIGKGTPAEIEAVIRSLAGGDAEVRRLVLNEGRRADVRSAMVKALSHEQLESLVAALGPEEAAAGRFVNRCISRGTTFEKRTPEVTGREAFSHQLWELSLAFLLVERKSRFNFKRYLQRLISGMASRYNMAYGTLLSVFRDVYATGGGKREQDDLALLDELWMEEHQRKSPATKEGRVTDGAGGAPLVSGDGNTTSASKKPPEETGAGAERPDAVATGQGPSADGSGHGDPATAHPALVRLLRLLDSDVPPTPGEKELCAREIRAALARNGAPFGKPLAERLRSLRAARRLAEILPARDGARVLGVLAPSWGLGVHGVLDAVIRAIGASGRNSGLGVWALRIRAWAFQLAAAPSHGPMTPTLFLRSLLAWMGRHGSPQLAGTLLGLLPAAVGKGPGGEAAAAAVHGVLYGGRAGSAKEATVTAPAPAVPEEKARHGKRSAQSVTPDASLSPAKQPWGTEVVEGEVCRVVSAGLVILSPYLPSLFSRLGYLEHGRFSDPAQADRAALLLHYLSHNALETPEYPLVLNCLLCGTASEGRILDPMVLSEGETGLADQLLRAVIAHWTALKNTSPQGLRESFLVRSGDLILKEGAWHLTVEPRAWDVLLDRLPWGISSIKHPWMKQVLYVNWR